MKSCFTPASKSTRTPSRSQNTLYFDVDDDTVDASLSDVELLFAVVLLVKKPESDFCVFVFLDCCDVADDDDAARLDMIDDRVRGDDDDVQRKARMWAVVLAARVKKSAVDRTAVVFEAIRT